MIELAPLMTTIGSTGALLADKGYGANALLDWLGQLDTSGGDTAQGKSKHATKL
jgi:hypothetical protein